MREVWNDEQGVSSNVVEVYIRYLRQKLEEGAIAAAPDLLLSESEEPLDDNRRDPSSYPWHRGVGPLESPFSAFRMLSDHLGLPFRRELLRRVFTDQVKRHSEASLALAGAVAESIGLQTQLLEIRADTISRLDPPLLVRWGNGMAVVYRTSATSILLGIPAVANQELSLDQFKEQWGE